MLKSFPRHNENNQDNWWTTLWPPLHMRTTQYKTHTVNTAQVC